MRRGLITLLLTGIALAVVYGLLFEPASRGWGYPGPRVGSSWFCWGGPSIYRDRPSARTGSLGGPGHAGRGPRAGK